MLFWFKNPSAKKKYFCREIVQVLGIQFVYATPKIKAKEDACVGFTDFFTYFYDKKNFANIIFSTRFKVFYVSVIVVLGVVCVVLQLRRLRLW